MITDKELAVQIPTAFKELFPDARRHIFQTRDYSVKCIKCGTPYRCGKNKRKCTVPDPIDVTDLGKAMEVFRDLPNGKAMDALIEVFTEHDETYSKGALEGGAKRVIFWWALRHTTPQQIWRICLLAKENEQ